MTHLFKFFMEKKKKTLARQLDLVYDNVCPNCKVKMGRLIGLKSKLKKLLTKIPRGKSAKVTKKHKHSSKIHHMKVPVMKKIKGKFKKTGKMRSQAYIILASGKRKFVKN